MKKRKWQTIVFILLIGLLSFVYIRLNDLYFSPEDVFWAYEGGSQEDLPEEIVFQFDLQEGGTVLVGRRKDGLSAVPVERSHFFFWRVKNGEVINNLLDCGDTLGGYLIYDGSYLGLCQNPEITEISLIIGNWEDRNWREYRYPIDGELIYIPREEIFQDKPFDVGGDYVIYKEGRNADGEVIYQWGDDGLAKALRNGSFIREKRTVTKPFITAPEQQE